MLHLTNKRGTKTAYTKLRKFLLADGYLMLEPELFMRIGTNRKGIEKHLRRIQEFNPGTGAINILKLTEKQFKSIIYLTGKEDYQKILSVINVALYHKKASAS